MKKLSFILMVTTLFFLSSGKVHASTLFNESMIGSPGNSWTPNYFFLINGFTSATYTDKGITCIDGQYCHYVAPISEQDNIVQINALSDGTPINFLFSCRDASDPNNLMDEARVFLHNDGTTHLEWFINGGGLGSTDTINYDYSPGIHKFELDCEGPNLTFKEDSRTLATGIFNTPVYGSFNYVRLDLWQGNWEFLNYQFCDINGCTPTPTPTEIQLNVPLIKQTTAPWNSQIYDSATKWAPKDPTINDWGCAVTSATMVLKYFGITRLPDNTPLDPGTLNTWLKSQPDGYIGNGLVNWLAIPRLTKLIQLAQNNPDFKFDAVRYKRVNSADKTTLLSDLKNNQPDILEEPRHFVVATGTQNDTFTINDPYFARQTLNDAYNNTFSSLERYIGSHTDLSYIMLTGDTSLNFSLTDATGSAVGEQFTQNPIEDPQNPGQLSGQPIHIFYFDEANSGSYTLNVTSDKNQLYSITEYLYDINGNVKKVTTEGEIDSTHPNTITVNFDKTNTSNDITQRVITFDTLIYDLKQLFQTGSLKKGLYEALSHLVQNAKKSSDKHQEILSKVQLYAFSVVLKANSSWLSTDTKTLLQNDINALLYNLQATKNAKQTEEIRYTGMNFGK